MAYIIDGEPTTVHISFAPEEISLLDRKSDELPSLKFMGNLFCEVASAPRSVSRQRSN